MKKILTTSVLLSALTAAVFAAGTDYKVQAVAPEIRPGESSDMAITITDGTGKNVPNARITGVKLDMAMQGMGDMAMPVKQVVSPNKGEYHFVGNIMHSGAWKLTVTARIPGESDPVTATVVLTAK
jgi:hypothetical protein